MLHQHCLEPNSPTEHSTCLLIFKAALRLLTLKAAAPGSAMLCRCSRTPTGQHLFCPLCCPNSAREGPFRPPLWDEEVGQAEENTVRLPLASIKQSRSPGFVRYTTFLRTSVSAFRRNLCKTKRNTLSFP